MISRPRLKARLAKEREERRKTAPQPDDAGLTPYQRLLRAAEDGQYEVLVAQLRREVEAERRKK